MAQSLDTARDAQIARVVAMVDGMARRDEADKLIAPLRPRLAQLRPQRPLTFCRLLFAPLDPVIVAPTQWRRGDASIPRTALLSLAAQAWSGLPPEQAEAIAAAMTNRFSGDLGAIAAAGGIAWRASAGALRTGAMPASWPDATGLGAEDHRAIAGAVAAVLDVATDIEALAVRSAGGEIDTADLRETVRMAGRATGGGPDGLALLLGVLLHRLPAVPSLLVAAGEIAGAQPDMAGGAALERAIDLLMARAGGDAIRNPDLRVAAQVVTRAAVLLDGIEAPGPAHRPSRKAQAEQLRREIDRDCRVRFAGELDARVARKAAGLDKATSDADVAAIEADARALRTFEAAGRKVGGAAQYDALLRDAAAGVSSNGQAPLADRVRLVEILLGSDAALELLGRGG